MRVLFTGGTGIISGEASRLALARGMELFVLNPRGVGELAGLGASWLRADYQDPAAVAAAVRDLHFDVVVDYLCYTKEQAEAMYEIFRDKTAHFIHISTATVYARPSRPPVATESAPLGNRYWDYAQKKIECELYYQERCRMDGFPVTIVRPSHTYGKGRFPMALSGAATSWTYVHMMQAGIPIVVHGDGNLLWTTTHSEDFAVGLCGLFGQPNSVGHAFHITTDDFMRWDDIIATTARLLGTEPNIRHVPTEVIVKKMPEYLGPLMGDKGWNALFDNSKIKAFVPDFKARVPLRAGVQRTLDYLAARPELQTVDEGYIAAMKNL